MNTIETNNKLYEKVEDFILEHSKKSGEDIYFDIEQVSNKDCFCLTDTLTSMVLEDWKEADD